MFVSVLGVGIICTFYTTVVSAPCLRTKGLFKKSNEELCLDLKGGLKAVMWIDVIQMGIILAGLLALTIKGTVDAGGMAEVWRKASDGGRLIFDECVLGWSKTCQ